MQEYSMESIQTFAKKIQEGSLSSEKITSESLKKATQLKDSNIFLEISTEKALEKARSIDQNRNADLNKQPLLGVPIAVKDNFCTQNIRTSCASKILENFTPSYNATVVDKLEAAGAIILGKTNMDEFAMGSTSESGYFGACINPQAPDRIAGGSSGGSAAAIAADIVAGSLGSDTGGSIRQPAACCGVVGMKPTYGRVSRYGLIAYASSLDQIGPLANNVSDTALLLNVIAGHDPKDCTSSEKPTEDYQADLQKEIRGLKIGIPKEYFGEGLDEECKQALLSSLEKLKQEGAELVEIQLPSLQYAISTYYILATAEASSNLSRFDGIRYTHRSQEATDLLSVYEKSRTEGFGDEVRQRILLGTFVLSSGYYDAYYLQAQKVRRVITDDFNKAFTQCDVIAAPTLPGLPTKVGKALENPLEMYLSDIYTVSLNLAGLPGISVPVSKVQGLSTSLQLFGKPFAERQLLQVASAVERYADLA